MRYFFSAGEPSGDLHGSRLIEQLSLMDDAECFGFGGDKMSAAGCDVIYPLVDRPVMGLKQAILAVPHFYRLLRQAEVCMDERRPDAVVLIDYPGFHWHLAKSAKRMGIPVFYYVPPQIWGWGTWRVAKMRRYVDHVLCTLPFEEAWYKSRDVRNVHYVGHPFFDDLARRRLNEEFLDHERQKEGPIVALLPGSRGYELNNNLSVIASSAKEVYRAVPGVRFLVGAFKQAHVPQIEKALGRLRLPLDIHVGKTPEIIAIADSAIAVSGSISLELLYHQTPTAIVYRIPLYMQYILRPLLLRSPYITLVNLMAGRRLFPEFVGSKDMSAKIGQVVTNWLEDSTRRERLRWQLGTLKRLYAAPGASERAADILCSQLGAAPRELLRAG